MLVAAGPAGCDGWPGGPSRTKNLLPLAPCFKHKAPPSTVRAGSPAGGGHAGWARLWDLLPFPATGWARAPFPCCRLRPGVGNRPLGAERAARQPREQGLAGESCYPQDLEEEISGQASCCWDPHGKGTRGPDLKCCFWEEGGRAGGGPCTGGEPRQPSWSVGWDVLVLLSTGSALLG